MLMTGVASVSFEGREPLIADKNGAIDVPVEFVTLAKEVFGMVEFVQAAKENSVKGKKRD